MKRWPIALLALAFPLLAHAGAISGRPALSLAAVASLVLAIAWPLWRHPLRFALVTGIAALILAWCWRAGAVTALTMIPPILITFAIGWQFARSLAPGRTPLVQRIVVALHAQAVDIPGVPAYTRRVTLVWALLLGSLCGLNVIYALLAVPGGFLHAAGVNAPVGVPLRHWSVLANVVNYVVIGGFFLAEYAYRRTRFPQQPYRNFGDFVARVARLGPAFWRAS